MLVTVCTRISVQQHVSKKVFVISYLIILIYVCLSGCIVCMPSEVEVQFVSDFANGKAGILEMHT